MRKERLFERLGRGLGYPPDARLLIVHEDDVGMNHGASRAFTGLSRDGFLTCGSVMVPCPWFVRSPISPRRISTLACT